MSRLSAPPANFLDGPCFCPAPGATMKFCAGDRMALPSAELRAGLEIARRKLDLLWAALSVALALFTWRYAARDPYTPVGLFVALHLQCAAIFAVRRPARRARAPAGNTRHAAVAQLFSRLRAGARGSRRARAAGRDRRRRRRAADAGLRAMPGSKLRRLSFSPGSPDRRHVPLRAPSDLFFLRAHRR